MDKARHKKLKKSGGFSLIELMIATVILTAGLVVILGSIIGMNAQQRYADQEAMASNYMSYLLEVLQQNASADGDISNVTGHVFDAIELPNLFLFDEGDEYATSIPGLGPVKLRMVQRDGGATANTVEIQIIMIVQDHRGRDVPYTTSKLITY